MCLRIDDKYEVFSCDYRAEQKAGFPSGDKCSTTQQIPREKHQQELVAKTRIVSNYILIENNWLCKKYFSKGNYTQNLLFHAT